MKTKLKLHLLFLAILGAATLARGQGTAFSYQGRLLDNGIAANGSYDFVFTVHDAEVAGNTLGAPLALDAIAVSAGQFAVPLDFGATMFTGPARWLEIGVRVNGAVGPHTTLSPRQALLPTPYAIFAGSAGNVANGTVTANQLNTGGLAPTPGQFLSYNGGNLSWSDPGVAVGDVWSLNGLDAYYNAGKVGIGTMVPLTPLEVNGVVRSTRSGVAPQYIQLNGGDSGSIKLTAQSTAAAEKILFIENLSGEATPGANNQIQFVLGTPAARSTKMTIRKGGLLIQATTPTSQPFEVRNFDGTQNFYISGADDVSPASFSMNGILVVDGRILCTGPITANSDRNAKTDFAPVDPAGVLERLAALPIRQWRFKTEAEQVKHIGPMAQDFHAAFGLGASSTGIATVDADGVAMAAIQGLNQKLEEQRAENRQLEQRLEKLELRMNHKNGGAK